VDRLRPTPDSLARLRTNILDDAREEEWLWAKIRSLESRDGFSLTNIFN
jgi:hypothetical protein